MLAIPGKSCGPCNLCCKILVIEDEDLKKDAGPLCKNCTATNGCKIYNKRPQTCRDYECEWLQQRELPAHLRPDKTGTILQVDPESMEYQAVCDPATPMAWRKSPHLFRHLVAKAKEGETVVAKSGLKTWRVYADGSYSPYSA